MKINKAIITAAGYGTRFLPYTKSIQKEMLPIVNRPLIDYIVEDCVKASIEEIVFVVNKRTRSQIESYYSEDKNLFKYLERMGKLDKYSSIQDIHNNAKFTYIEQPDEGLYGTAVPLKLVEDVVKHDDAFLMFMGDDFIYNTDGSSEAKKMIEKFISGDYEAMVSAIGVSEDLFSKYGIIVTQKDNEDLLLKNIVEKPSRVNAPSNLANISKFIFKPSIYKYLEKQLPDKVHEELLITDTVIELSKEYKVLVYIPKGKYYDCGYPKGWLKANTDLMN